MASGIRRTDVTGFVGGLNTDVIGASNTLLEARDVWIDRIGEIRKRGGKASLRTDFHNTAATASAAYVNTFHPYCGGLGVVYNTTDSKYSVFRLGLDPATTCGFLGSALYTASGTQYDVSAHTVATSIENEVVLAGGDGPPIKVGSRYDSGHSSTNYGTTPKYSTGTVTNGSGSATARRTFTVATGNTSSMTAGMYLWLNDASLDQVRFKIESITNSSTFVVEKDPGSTLSGATTYAVTSLAQVYGPATIFASYTDRTATKEYPVCGTAEAHGGRLFVAATGEVDGAHYERIRWSGLPYEQSAPYYGMDYWQADAYADVYPGIGGNVIYALVSYGHELLIFKGGAFFKLTGDVASDGTDLGAAITIVDRTLGARASQVVVTPIGVAISSNRGAYLYDGSLRSLTDGRISQRWKALFGAAAPSVSCVGDRIIFHGNSNALVYYFNNDTWVEQAYENVGYSRIVQYKSSTGDNTYEVALYAYGANGGGAHDWATDHTTGNKSDALSTSNPRAQLTTQPILLGRGPIDNGRPKTVYVNSILTDAASDNPVWTVTLLRGRYGTTTGAASALSVGTIAESSTDKTVRIEVSGADMVSSACRVRLVQTNAAADGRVYGIGLDYHHVDRDNAGN